MSAATSPFSHTGTRPSRSATTASARTPFGGPLMPPLVANTPLAARTPGTTKARSPSPNYFGFQASASTLPVSTYDGQHARQNWSPPSSAVRSTAAFSPAYVPLEQNPEFAAFRRQSEGLGRSFNLSSFSGLAKPATVASPKAIASDKQENEYFGSTPSTIKVHGPAKSPPLIRPNLSTLDPDLGNSIRSPKRHLSSDSTNFPPAVRKASPATFTPSESAPFGPEVALAHARTESPAIFKLPTKIPTFTKDSRASTLPASLEPSAEDVLVTPQHVVTLIEQQSEDILILDLRVAAQHAKSRISGALNLCIPTTLLKRPSFNVQKLAETFHQEKDRKRFENWKGSKYIVVYDASSAQLKDAAICLNTIKKFETEGYGGTMYIIKGGFQQFAKSFPAHVDKKLALGGSTGAAKLTMPGQNAPLPVIGGCPMPAAATKSAANPFFGNIRQNMDLIGGVGQMEIKLPGEMTEELSSQIPDWLTHASHADDKGARVSDKFLKIEQKEQKRMQDALSEEVSYGTPTAKGPTAKIKIAGIEKGSKNRYNNIWPFEHSRVKLEDVPADGCDYVNANHVTSSLSNKRYIATQGPIPATFADFWNVVWQQDVRVIVMLTAEKEGGQIKAHDYWSDRRYGPFKLDLMREWKATLDPNKIHRHRTRQASHGHGKTPAKPGYPRSDSGQSIARSPIDAAPTNEEPYIKVRRLTLSHENFPFEPMREITHIQYSSWPDFGAPAHPSHLLGLVEQTDAVIRSTNGTHHGDPALASRPVVVHCSAGCGRTGTFCTVDSVIDMLKRQRRSRSSTGGSTSQRDASPMDIDGRRKSSLSPNKSRPFLDAENPFFFSSPPPMKDMKLSSSPPSMSPDQPQQTSQSGQPGDAMDLDGDWLDKHDLDLVEKTVEDFRHQRISMVQSLRQFVLCYETVLEWLVEEDRREQESQAAATAV